MARIGFKKAYYCKLVKHHTYDSKLEYDPNIVGNKWAFEKVVDEKFAPEYNNAELYANDGLAETDYSFKKGTLSVTIVDDDDEFIAGIFGNEYGTDGNVVCTINDTAPEYGYAHIVTKMVNGVRKYKVEIFPRVKWTKVTTDNKSRGESVEFGTTSLEGIVMPLEKPVVTKTDEEIKEGTWEMHKTFTNYEDAVSYINGIIIPEGTSLGEEV